jgi:hypothetical protein
MVTRNALDRPKDGHDPVGASQWLIDLVDMTTKVRLRPGFIDATPGWCYDMDKHEGLRTPLAEMKQHMIDAHGFIYEEYERPLLQQPDELGRLHAENERLKTLEVWYTEAIDALHADIEHLKAELGEVTDLYTTYRGLVHDGVQVADVIKSLRGQLAALCISERAWTDQNTRLRAAVETAAAMVRNADPDLSDALLRTLGSAKDG